jgi:hypothetical protein
VKTTAVTISIAQAAAEQLHRIKATPAIVAGAIADAATAGTHYKSGIKSGN